MIIVACKHHIPMQSDSIYLSIYINLWNLVPSCLPNMAMTSHTHTHNFLQANINLVNSYYIFVPLPGGFSCFSQTQVHKHWCDSFDIGLSICWANPQPMTTTLHQAWACLGYHTKVCTFHISLGFENEVRYCIWFIDQKIFVWNESFYGRPIAASSKLSFSHLHCPLQYVVQPMDGRHNKW